MHVWCFTYWNDAYFHLLSRFGSPSKEDQRKYVTFVESIKRFRTSNVKVSLYFVWHIHISDYPATHQDIRMHVLLR
jgi:hypothetical protein